MKEIQFIETMRIAGGAIVNLQGHAERMRATVREVYGHESELAQLADLALPDGAEKCRIVYDETIRTVEFSGYTPRSISSLRLVEADAQLDYHLKYLDRTALTQLSAQRGGCDEVLIVKDGFVTDTSFSNVVFTDGKRFVTPDTYLLPGTMRAMLLRSGAIVEAPVRVEDIGSFTHVSLINAMLPMDRGAWIPVENISLLGDL
jgi:4-amino-4-deoxychorismate lyase